MSSDEHLESERELRSSKIVAVSTDRLACPYSDPLFILACPAFRPTSSLNEYWPTDRQVFSAQEVFQELTCTHRRRLFAWPAPGGSADYLRNKDLFRV